MIDTSVVQVERVPSAVVTETAEFGVLTASCGLKLALGFTIWGGFVTVVDVHPTWRCTSPPGVVPVGLVNDVGDCHDAANLQREGTFIYLLVFTWRKLCSFFKGCGFLFVYC